MKKISNIIIFISCMILTLVSGNCQVKASKYDKPYVEIDSYSIESEAIVPGEEFELNLVFRNTSSSKEIGSCLVTYESPDGSVEPVYGQSNQFFLKKINAGETEEVTVKLKANAGIETLSTQLVFSILYADEKDMDNNNTTKIFLPVSTSGTLRIENISVPNIVTLGTKSRISITYGNYGVDELSNIVLHIVGNKLNTELEYPLESIGGGSKKYAEAYIDYQKTGNQNIQISFTYDDSDGLRHETDLQSYEVTVSNNEDGGFVVDSNNSGSSIKNYVIQFLVIIAIIAILVVLIIFYRKKNNKIWKE